MGTWPRQARASWAIHRYSPPAFDTFPHFVTIAGNLDSEKLRESWQRSMMCHNGWKVDLPDKGACSDSSERNKGVGSFLHNIVDIGSTPFRTARFRESGDAYPQPTYHTHTFFSCEQL
ncbi:hypothetical protein J6590_096268 [Homalodisca vitripennis]|nr:hypothetical protein J6590_031352 [Homalodisca vitripennis]KAG8334182.1 hypothetical protein J6590_096268 [Homalodisca vitripennis]